MNCFTSVAIWGGAPSCTNFTLSIGHYVPISKILLSIVAFLSSVFHWLNRSFSIILPKATKISKVKPHQKVTCGACKGSSVYICGFSFAQILQWFVSFPCNEKWVSSDHKILNSHCEFSSNSGKVQFANVVSLCYLATTVDAIAISRAMIVTHHEGSEIPMYSALPCSVQLFVCLILVLVLRLFSIPWKCSFAKTHCRYESLTFLAHHFDADPANFPFIWNIV